jgi:hypothetical protein
MIRKVAACMVALAACACNQTSENRAETNEIVTTAPPNETSPTSTAATTENAQANVSLPDDRTPLEEPKGPIDPKSAEAAGQVVQHYAALIEQGRWREAKDFWSNDAAAEHFRTELADYSAVHMEIGKPGEMEGAAGSSYVTVPVIFYGTKTKSGSYRRAADIILRRVNDVPGSTEAQRRWHIERIDWTTGA